MEQAECEEATAWGLENGRRTPYVVSYKREDAIAWGLENGMRTPHVVSYKWEDAIAWGLENGAVGCWRVMGRRVRQKDCLGIRRFCAGAFWRSACGGPHILEGMVTLHCEGVKGVVRWVANQRRDGRHGKNGRNGTNEGCG